MKSSFNAFLRAYNLFSIFFFLFGVIAITVGGQPLIRGEAFNDPVIIHGIYIFRIVVIFLFGSGFVISSLLFISLRRKSITAYKKIIDRIANDRSMSFNLNISFPETDEFGDLGRWLNRFVATLRKFDQLKVERLRAAQQKISFLSEAMNKGVVVLSRERRISFVNSHFNRLLNLGDKSIIGLPIEKIISDERFLKTLDMLEEKPKNTQIDDLKIKVDNVIYRTKVMLVPIISSELKLEEVLVIFDYIQKKVLQR